MSIQASRMLRIICKFHLVENVASHGIQNELLLYDLCSGESCCSMPAYLIGIICWTDKNECERLFCRFFTL